MKCDQCKCSEELNTINKNQILLNLINLGVGETAFPFWINRRTRKLYADSKR